ncbi:hypothetical protein PV08_10868 [Exophiala spinifera]|uniref:Epoxide hydrolase N-terminal domain-containing protein n=1 Tax=Exophiala spinifera TaxID=91928 RepID=A0A0D1ZF33_9EURO|nr:uncharacterized protein PV08_10868 [Exophiala spinifera]KIW11567.1 hypothetical protein PV08_10868 [Exophiala spinifera]
MADPPRRPLSERDLNLNFKATFSDEVLPFTISVSEDFLGLTRLKASLTRFVDDQDQPDHEDGPPRRSAEAIAKYWSESYDWRRVEASLNGRLKQFTTIVHTAQTALHPYPEPVPLHFVHHRSPRADAIPLLFVHGWPGSFVEVLDVVERLTNPPSASHCAFHVVAPSIPGYGFSPAPRAPGFGYRQAGATFHALMTARLGYGRYVFQGGDAGDFINRYAAVDFPRSVVSGLSNFWVVPPSPADVERHARRETSDDEAYLIELYRRFTSQAWAYGHLHQTRPLRLAVGLTDSPVGLAMWIYDAVRTGVDRPDDIWTPERLITWTMMHWVNGPYGAFGLYKNGAKDGAISPIGINMLPYVHQPVAISEFPYDLWYRTPLEWARRCGNVKYRTVHDRGGHFASLDAPDLLLEDIWRFFGDREVSGTKVFFENDTN